MIKNRETTYRIELVFKISYFILTIISFNIFCARQFYVTLLSYVVVCIGLLVGVFRIKRLNNYVNQKVWLLVAFVLSYILGAINTFRYGYIENVQALVWMCIQYFLVFSFDVNQDERLVLKEFNAISILFIAYTFIVAVAGIIMVIANWGHYKEMDGLIFAVGFIWNRLWGCYVDPNYGAIFSLISIVLSIYFFKKSSNKIIKVALIINIIFEYLYICYSDSRTGRLAVIIVITVFLYCTFVKQFEYNNKNLKVMMAMFVAMVIALLLWGSIYLVRNITSELQVEDSYNAAIESGFSSEEAKYFADLSRIGRHQEEINEGDVSNNRFDIWFSAFDIFKANPIFGVSFRNIMDFAIDKQPDGFIAVSGFDSMHNAFVDILVSQGIIGIILVAALVYCVLSDIFKKINCLDKEHYSLVVALFSSVVAIVVSMMFYSESFYMNTGGAFLFWYFLGLIVNYILPREAKYDEAKSSLL